jgi:hypothetical protein
MRAAEGRLPDFSELARRAEGTSSTRLGWPAPSDPAAAIDDAEYDLSVLDRLLAAPDQERGSARYLLTTNPYLAQALRSRGPTLEFEVDVSRWACSAVERRHGYFHEAQAW